MELVDREKACQEILATRKYIEGPPGNTQDNWILQYLKERLHKNMNESYEIWKEVFESKHGEDSNGWRGVFAQKRENLKGVTIAPVKNRKIYQREIDLINSCQLKTVWQKEILLAMVCYFKFTGKNQVGNIFVDELVKYSKNAPACTTPFMANDIVEESVRVGLFKKIEKEQWDNEGGVLYKTIVYEFEDKKQSDDIISFEIWNAYDVSKYSGWFDSKLVCEKCGKEFVGNCRTKRSICDKCWKEFEKNRIRIAVRKTRM
mgnify:FL=1|jgi:hypothetical protein